MLDSYDKLYFSGIICTVVGISMFCNLYSILSVIFGWIIFIVGIILLSIECCTQRDNNNNNNNQAPSNQIQMQANPVSVPYPQAPQMMAQPQQMMPQHSVDYNTQQPVVMNQGNLIR